MGVETAFRRGYFSIKGKRVNFYPRILEKPKVGRKTVVHDFVYSKERLVEDMGMSAPIYNLKIEIQETAGFSYKRANKLFTEAVQTAGICVLSHPTEGRKNVVIVDANQTQDIITLNGIANWNISFFEASLNKFPQATTGSKNLLNRISDAVNDTSEAMFNAIDKFNETAEVFYQAKDTLEDITSIINETVSIANGLTDEISSFVAEIQGFQSSITNLLLAPSTLGNRFNGLFGSLSQVTNNLSTLSDISFNIFGAGNNRVNFTGDSATVRNINRNNNVIYNVNDAQSLSIACLASTNINYQSQEDVDVMIKRINKAFNSIDLDIFDQDLYYHLRDLVISTKEYLNNLKISLPYNIKLELKNPVPASVLAYDIYGDGRRGEEIVANNFIEDPAFVVGIINILSK